MKKIILLAVVLGLFMSGCAGGKWVKQDMTRLEEDKFDCDYKSTMMSSGIQVVLERGILGKYVHQKDIFGDCMRSKGYWYERNKGNGK